LASAYPDPGALTFNATGPVQDAAGDPAFPLVETTLLPAGGTGSPGSPYVGHANQPTTANVFFDYTPKFDDTVYSIDGRLGTATLPAGTYNIGIACATATGAVDTFWNAQVTVTANSQDAAGEVWQTVPNPQVPESPWSLALPISAAVILGGGGYLVVRRRRRAVPTAA
jgi:hypothetical protein